MYAYRTPGVYTEWLDTAPGTRPLRTDIAGFVGIAARGSLHRPIRIESWAQFVGHFGGHIPQAYLAYAVRGFFANGGQTCWVVRVADPQKASAAWLDLRGEDAAQALRLTASSPGIWGNRISISVVRTAAGRFSLTVRMPDLAQELWRDLSMDADDAAYAPRVLNHEASGSRLVNAAPSPHRRGDSASNLLEMEGRLSLGADGLQTLRPEHFSGDSFKPDEPWGLALFEGVDEVSIVAMPDILRKPPDEPCTITPRPNCESLNPPDRPLRYAEQPLEYPPGFKSEQIHRLQQAMITHCRHLQDRVAVLDAPDAQVNPAGILKERKQLGAQDLPAHRYAALYYPWIKVVDPLGLPGRPLTIPPSGHVAGLYATTDIKIGVHKPPANLPLEAVEDLAFAVDPIDHGHLNEQGINVIRSFPGRGIRIAGARTLSNEAEWRFVNVRRLLIMIEKAIDEQTQWTVFEPNNHALWHDLERTVRGVLHGLWQRSMLDGATPEDAYHVRCDETTNPPEETENGRMICLIGVQPPQPAEFVVIRIGKTENGTEFLENGGAIDG